MAFHHIFLIETVETGHIKLKPYGPRPLHLLHKVVQWQLLICYSVTPSRLCYSWIKSSDLSSFLNCSKDNEPNCGIFLKRKLSGCHHTLEERRGKVVLLMYVLIVFFFIHLKKIIVSHLRWWNKILFSVTWEKITCWVSIFRFTLLVCTTVHEKRVVKVANSKSKKSVHSGNQKLMEAYVFPLFTFMKDNTIKRGFLRFRNSKMPHLKNKKAKI